MLVFVRSDSYSRNPLNRFVGYAGLLTIISSFVNVLRLKSKKKVLAFLKSLSRYKYPLTVNHIVKRDNVPLIKS